MKIGIPQIIVLALLAINLGVNMKKHGEPHLEHYNGWTIFSQRQLTSLCFGGAASSDKECDYEGKNN